MAATLDEQVTAFRNRPLGDKAVPYAFFDALYVKVREHKRVCSRAVLIGIGVNEDGEREVLGLAVADTEMTASWQSFMQSLLTRGLRGLRLAISDAHEGLQRAIPATFNVSSA